MMHTFVPLLMPFITKGGTVFLPILREKSVIFRTR
jgi:hypothetical protein